MLYIIADDFAPLIQWYFAEESSMNAVKVLFENEGVEGIELIFEAMK